MTRTSKGPDPARPTRCERAVVLGGFAVAALHTGVSAAAGTGMETAGAVWLGAVAWTVPASLACALRRGIRRGDWSAFRRRGRPGPCEETPDRDYGNGIFMGRGYEQDHDTTGYSTHFHAP